MGNLSRRNFMIKGLKVAGAVVTPLILSRILGCKEIYRDADISQQNLFYEGDVRGKYVKLYRGNKNSPDRLEIYTQEFTGESKGKGLIEIIENWEKSSEVIGDHKYDKYIIANGGNPIIFTRDYTQDANRNKIKHKYQQNPKKDKMIANVLNSNKIELIKATKTWHEYTEQIYRLKGKERRQRGK
ncbi:MAG: hypothetical protein KKF48_03455 [Nanoarchaeota archaeon]|nr:hypothetical protein [Nanoarchaeota archaeon]MBU1028076.1 hypothetical protein [Nanoarchaeota archaeon]